MLFALANIELLKAARGGGHHRLRLYYVGVLALELIVFGSLYVVRTYVGDPVPPRLLDARLNDLAALWFELLVIQHFLLVAGIAPALAGGVVTEEKKRGTLELLLTTHLRTREILPGKALAALVQVHCLALPAAPALAWLGMFAGMQPLAVLWWLIDTTAFAFFLVAASLLASVLARTTARAMTASYVLLGTVLIGLFVGVPSETLFSWQYDIGLEAAVVWRWIAFAGFGAVLLTAAVICLRPAYERYAERSVSRREAAVFRLRPPVSTQPLRWKENYLGQLAFLPFLSLLPRWVKVALVCLVPVAVAALVSFREESVIFICAAMIFGPGLAVGLKSAAALSSERESDTWETLRITLLEPRQIVRGKLWGMIDGARPYLIPLLASSVLTVALTQPIGYVAAPLVAWVLGWAMLYFQAVNGIYWSARHSTWQALLRTQADFTWCLVGRYYFLGIAGAAASFSCLNLFGRFPWSPLGSILVMGFSYIGLVFVSLFANAEKLLQDTEKLLRSPDATS